MTGKRVSPKTVARDERLRRYAELRDEGVTRGDAARELGVEYFGAGAAYERWYLADRGLPLPPRRVRRTKHISTWGF